MVFLLGLGIDNAGEMAKFAKKEVFYDHKLPYIKNKRMERKAP